MTAQRLAPVLETVAAVIRPLRCGDAESLVEALATTEVARFIPAPPSTAATFRRYVAWAGRERRAGRHIALAVVPHDVGRAVGLFQVRRYGPAWALAEARRCCASRTSAVITGSTSTSGPSSPGGGPATA